jgi:hypothetical protein
MNERLITGPTKPMVESGFGYDLKVIKHNHACPWRPNHPCHLAGKGDPMDPFQRCLLCLLGEILRELEWKRER